MKQKEKSTLAEVELELAKVLQKYSWLLEGYRVKVYKKKDPEKLHELPKRRVISLDVDLAHQIYNIAYANKIRPEAALDMFVARNSQMYELIPDRPWNSDAFAKRYHLFRNVEEENIA